MAVFGDATPEEDARAACGAAVLAAVRMLERFSELELEWRSSWIDQFLSERDEGVAMLLGIGISYGPATFGFISTEGTRHYTAIGSYVNLAQRLEGEAGVPLAGSPLKGSIVASATVMRNTGERLPDESKIGWVRGSLVQAKGVAYPLQAYYAVGGS